ncbi:MAG: DMT family transporter [Terriglobales bacterium]
MTTWLLTLVTMLAFAANSLLCRLALQRTHIDPASFTLVRIGSGALMLWMLAAAGGSRKRSGNWISALALFGYAAAFSFAYVSLAVGTGALLLFGAVQATMIVRGLVSGERMNGPQVVGLLLALVGLVILVLPGLSAPPLMGALLMTGAGVCWGIYSLRGRRGSDPMAATAGNFLRALPFAVVVWLVFVRGVHLPLMGIVYAVLSGALASGLGYAIWYAALRGLTATRAAVVQLSVPVLAAAAGVGFLGERITPRLTVSAVAVLGGIALFVLERKSSVAARAK